MKPTDDLSGAFSALSWGWVAAQIALLTALILAPPEPRSASLQPLKPLGIALQGGGFALIAASALKLGRSLTPLPSPLEKAQLQTDGLFGLVRHPIYSGVMIWAVGFSLERGGWKHGLLTALIALFFNFKARHEETLLKRKFPGYAAYARRTPRFIPVLRFISNRKR